LPELPEVPNLDVSKLFDTNISGDNQLANTESSSEKKAKRKAARKQLKNKLEEQKTNRPPDKDNLDAGVGNYSVNDTSKL